MVVKLWGEALWLSAPAQYRTMKCPARGRMRRMFLNKRYKNACSTARISHRTMNAMQVLVVDDDEMCASAISHVIRAVRPRSTVSVAYNGDDALDAVEAAHSNSASVDICFLDVNLRGEKGYTVTKLLRRCEKAAPTLPRTFVVGVSADVSNRVRCMSAGMDGFVGKPVTPEKLRKFLLGRCTT